MLSRRSMLGVTALGVAGTGVSVIGGLAGGVHGSSGTALANNTPHEPASSPSNTESVIQNLKEQEKLPPIQRFGRMMHTYLDGQIREKMQDRQSKLSQINTREAALSYIQDVSQKIRTAFGSFPERTPLNAQITGTLIRDTYRVDKLLYESQPGFFVTANLYVPTATKGPFPAVVGECGHAVNGKAYPSYQSFAQGLARQGYIVLIFDPVSQGERIQYPADDAAKSRIGIGVLEHLHEGNQQFLINEFLGTTRAWDAIRALDYLQSREDVIPHQIGITGSSGGGTLTMWLCGLDSRWGMAAPSCAVTSFYRNFQNELPTDTEQCPPEALQFGLDHADFVAVMAPKPVVILAQEEDFFDVRGTIQAYEELRKIWRLLGHEENLKLSIAPGGHDYSRVSREAMYAHFHQATGQTKASTEPQIVLEKDADLFVTTQGQVAELKGATVFSMTAQKARLKAQARPRKVGEDWKKQLRACLQLPETFSVPDYRILRSVSGRKYPRPGVTHYALQTEPGIETIVYRLAQQRLESRPPVLKEGCALYVSSLSADSELREEAWLRRRIESNPDQPFFACDLRGVGDSRPDTCGGTQTYLQPYGNDYFYAIHSLMLGRPIPSQRVFDLLSTVAWLKSIGHSSIDLIAFERGTIPALLAACLSEEIASVQFVGLPESYLAMATTEDYQWPLSSMIPDVLSKFDFPDAVEQIKSRGIRWIDVS